MKTLPTRKRPLRNLLAKLLANRTAQKELDRIIQRAQYYSGIGAGDGVKESGELATLSKLTKRNTPPYLIIDGGANIGQFLTQTNRLLPDEERVIHCFEPSKAAFAELKQAARGVKNVKLVPMAVGREECIALLYADAPDSQLASLSKRAIEHFRLEFCHEEKVQVTTIDTYCNRNSISFIHLLKLDIEGHELDALEGASAMLSKQSIDMVSFEFGGTNIDSKTYFRDLWRFLHNRQYSVYRITPAGYLFHVDKYKEYYEQFRTTNFVALRNT
jgi:FkbM family methyltransferase